MQADEARRRVNAPGLVVFDGSVGLVDVRKTQRRKQRVVERPGTRKIVHAQVEVIEARKIVFVHHSSFGPVRPNRSTLTLRDQCDRRLLDGRH